HQRRDIPVYMDHDETWRLGTVEHLERSKRLGLLAFARLEVDVADLLADGRWHWSDGITSYRPGDTRHRENVELREGSLVRATANLGTGAVVFSTDERAPRSMPMAWDDTWERGVAAVQSRRYRRAADTLDVVDLDVLDLFDERRTDPEAARVRL